MYFVTGKLSSNSLILKRIVPVIEFTPTRISDLFFYIKELLREKKYTIEGAKKILEDYEQDKKPAIEVKEKKSHPETEISVEVDKSSPSVKEDLEEIKDFLKHLLTKL